jgi:hypothetical protein
MKKTNGSMIMMVTAAIYLIWVYGFSPKAELSRKISSLKNEIISYHDENKEWPKDLNFITNKEILICNGNEVEYNPVEPSFRFEVTYWSPLEKINDFLDNSKTTGLGFNFSHLNKD